MNREIRFRAWDKAEQKWLKQDAFLVSPQHGGIMPWFDNNEVGTSLQHVELMQYTGLKDKNGKEIYEGDVIRCNYCAKDHGEVYWNKSGADFRIRWKDDCCANARLTHIDNWCAVIGNIYQHPELLTV